MAGYATDGSFTVKTLAELLDSVAARQRGLIDDNLDTTQFGVVGQLNGIFCSELAELWELAEAVHDAIDPDKAVGVQQDTLYALTGVTREGAKPSRVVAQVTLAPGADIAVGLAQASVLGKSDVKFRNAEPMVNSSGVEAVFNVAFTSVATGAVLANAGTLTVIDTVLPGWVGVTNASDAEPGSDIEGNSAFRRRRVDELVAEGGGSLPGLRADLLRLETVHAAYVLENDEEVTVDGLPPKSFEAIVQSVAGADDEDAIAQVIWTGKPSGIYPQGTEPAILVNGNDGFDHAVRFSRPIVRPIYVSLRLLTDPSRYAGDEAAKTSIALASQDVTAVGYLDVGADVYAGRIVAAAMALKGVINAEARLSFDPILNFDSAATALVISTRELAAVDTSRITISAFP